MSDGVTAMMDCDGRYLLIIRGVLPRRVGAMIAVAPISRATRNALRVTACAMSSPMSSSRKNRFTRDSYSGEVSTARAIESMTCTAATGYSPLAVSPESMTASEPSKMAFATSVASARVGRGLWIIESSICVAVMTALF